MCFYLEGDNDAHNALSSAAPLSRANVCRPHTHAWGAVKISLKNIKKHKKIYRNVVVLHPTYFIIFVVFSLLNDRRERVDNA